MTGATVPGPADQPARPAEAAASDTSPDALDPERVVAVAADVLARHWRDPGFCVPNAATYPWQWLWDSCFHAVCWARLGHPDRARTELANALSQQAPDGFVPHMTYWSARGRPDDDTHATFWGRPGTSSITQPPMYGHAVAELVRRGVDVDADLVDRAGRGLRFLFEARSRDGVGPVIVHPWESGCDDSPRWDAWTPEGASATRPARWKTVKGDLVGALQFAPGGSPVASTAFEVAPAGFDALVAFNARELAEISGDRELAVAADHLAARFDDQWEAAGATWVDQVVIGPEGTVATRTVESLLPLLVSIHPTAVDAAFAQLADPTAFGARFGPTGVHRADASFDPRTYWRGPAWPQLNYLLWLAAQRRGRAQDATRLADGLVAGAARSGFAEYWEPDTGEGLGAVPQSWTALAALVI